MRSRLGMIAATLLVTCLAGVAQSEPLRLVITGSTEMIEIRQVEVLRLETERDVRTNSNHALLCVVPAKSEDIKQFTTRAVGREVAITGGCTPLKAIWKGIVREVILGGCFQMRGQDNVEAAALVDELAKTRRTGCAVY